jgi:hypothetical protein
MAIFLQDLDQRFAIVDPKTGRPTEYFMTLLKGQTGELAGATGDLQTDVETLFDDKADKATTISPGFGLSGGGDLSENRTLALGNPVLVDPNADRILFWDDSAGNFAWLTPGSNLSITGTTLNASGGGGSALRPAVSTTNNYYPPDGLQFNTTTISAAEDVIYLVPFSKAITITAIASENTTNTAGSSVRFGLYASDPSTGRPTTLIEGSSTIATTSNGIKAFTLATPYPVTGLVWLARNASHNLTWRQGVRTYNHEVVGNSALNIASTGGETAFTYTTAYAAMPADLTGLGGINTVTTLIAARA